MNNLLKKFRAGLVAVLMPLICLHAVPAQAGPGYALSFNGTNTHVWINRPVSNDFTIEFWMNSTQVAGAATQWTQGMGLVDGDVAGAASDFGVSLGAGMVVFGTGGVGDVSIRSGVVADGKWHHVAATRVRTNGLMRLYVDGVLVASGTGSTVALASAAQLRFGSLATGVNYYKGLLDDVRIWGVARSQAEIQGWMGRPTDAGDPNLAGYWPFREGPLGMQTADVTGHGFPGRLVNRPMWVLSPVGWYPSVQLAGANPLTNECHGAFQDPGAFQLVSPAAVGAGSHHSLTVNADGTVSFWGMNQNDSGTVPASATNVVAVAGGYEHTVALRADGTLVPWGGNFNGQLNIPASVSGIVAIDCGDNHTLALKSDGTVLGFGTDGYGETKPPAHATNMVGVACGFTHSLGLRADGTPINWGDNRSGQLNIPAEATNLVGIAAGGAHNLGIKADGTVVGWGYNHSGEINVPATATNVLAIAAGGGFSAALRGDGRVVVWGGESFGLRNVPAAATNIVAIAAGLAHIVALRDDGMVFAWGLNDNGQTNAAAGMRQIPFTGTLSNNLNTASPGTYQVTYAQTNIHGGYMLARRSVVVVDTTPPAVTLNGEDPMIITNSNRSFTDPGATATDACAGGVSVAASGSVNVGHPGVYTMTYSAVDSYGNIGTASRTVCVALPPLIPGDVNGDGTVDGAEFAALLRNLHGNGVVTQPELKLVLSNYSPDRQSFQMTAVAGLGGRNVTFALTNDLSGAFSVESSTDLLNWSLLGPAVPRYEYSDTNAPAGPQRYYRLRWR